MKTVRIFGAGLYIQTPPIPDTEAQQIVTALAQEWRANTNKRLTILSTDEEIHLNPALVTAITTHTPADDQAPG